MMTSVSTFLTRTWRNTRDLFFFRRRPIWLGVPKDWEAPEDEAVFEQQLQWDDFITNSDIPAAEAAKHPVIQQDIADLRQYLIPTFYEMSQKSKYYQNMYYFYQWIFIIGAFATTVFGTLATFYVPTSETTAVVTTVAPTSTQIAATSVGTPVATEAIVASAVQSSTVTTTSVGGNSAFSQFFSIITAILGAITAFTTTLSNRHDPQKRWGNTRRLAEEMRMQYFKYMSHQPPYDGGDRINKLRENIMKVKEQEYV
jgi:hypothetical protein